MEHITSPNYTEVCLTAKMLHQGLQLNLARIGQLALGFTTLLLLIIAIRIHTRNKLSLHYNFMLLVTNIIILYAYNSIGMIAVNLRYQIPLIFDAEPCQFLTPMWIIVALRIYSYIYSTAFVLFHFALTTERARATIFARRYESEGSRYAVFCIVITWISVVAFNGYMVYLAVNDPQFQTPGIHISITTAANSFHLIIVHIFSAVIVVITAIIDYFLLYTNRKNRRKVEDYSLSRNYQINENIIVMKLLWPLDVCFAIGFSLYFIGSSYLRLNRDKVSLTDYVADYDILYMILPIHSVITMLLYLHFVKNNKCRTNAVVEPGDHTQIYFEQLKSQWDINQKRSTR